jgi:hypothetical protein
MTKATESDYDALAGRLDLILQKVPKPTATEAHAAWAAFRDDQTERNWRSFVFKLAFAPYSHLTTTEVENTLKGANPYPDATSDEVDYADSFWGLPEWAGSWDD